MKKGHVIAAVTIALPEIALVNEEAFAEVIMRPVCSVALLIRTLVTATRSGANDTLLISPKGLSEALLQQWMQGAVRYGAQIKVIYVSAFHPQSRASWDQLKPQLEDRFLWVPWNWVTTKQFLVHLPLVDSRLVDWATPAFTTLYEVTDDEYPSTPPHPEGVAVTSPENVTNTDRFLVAHSGKILDGIHTSFNRRLCRPFAMLLSHTSVTPTTESVSEVRIFGSTKITINYFDYAPKSQHATESARQRALNQ